MGIVWLASYPKSGNTWVRFLLYGVMYDAPAQSLDIARKIPDIHRPLPFENADAKRLFVKTHFAFSAKHPKARQTERAVLIIRNPRDVLLSALNYRRLSGLTPQQTSDEQYARAFIAARGDPQFEALGYGTWPGHIRSWQSQSDFPVHTIRYEDLKDDTPGVLRGVLDFLEIEADDDAIERAVRASSFDAMRAMEIREKHQRAKDARKQSLFVGTESARQSGTYFMNSGKTGHTLAEIAPALQDAFDRNFADEMREFGYEP